MHFHCFLWFLTIFLIFHKHGQNSWFQTMEFIESTHAKLIRALGGPDIHDIFFNIACLIFDWLCLLFVECMRLFWIFYWANLVSHRGALACYPDICFICLDKTNVVSHFQTNFSCFMIALERPFRYALWLSLMIRLSC